MLERVAQKKTTFEQAFGDWWSTQRQEFQDRVGRSDARVAFRAGFAAGHNKDSRRFVFKVGKFRITVWGASAAEAKQKAMAEADLRAAQRGWPTPKNGWRLEEFK